MVEIVVADLEYPLIPIGGSTRHAVSAEELRSRVAVSVVGVMATNLNKNIPTGGGCRNIVLIKHAISAVVLLRS